MSDELSGAVPDVWLVELTNEQMATFWSVTESYEEDQLGSWDAESCDWPDKMTELRLLQAAVEQARPIWEQSPTNKEQ